MNPHRLTIAQQLAPAEVEPETPEADPLDYVVGGIFPLWLAAQICQPVTAARNSGDKTVPSVMLVERLAQCRNMDVEVSLFRGILTNIVMTLSGLPMHKSIGRAAAAGVVVSVPATIAAALASKANHPLELGSIDITMWACIAPAQAAAAWLGARLAPVMSAELLSRVFATALSVTGVTMLHSSLT